MQKILIVRYNIQSVIYQLYLYYSLADIENTENKQGVDSSVVLVYSPK